MIEGITGYDTGPHQLTHCQTQNSMIMDWRMHRHCSSKVSDVAVKGQW